MYSELKYCYDLSPSSKTAVRSRASVGSKDSECTSVQRYSALNPWISFISISMYEEFEKSLLKSGETAKVLVPNDSSCILRTNPYREQRSFTSNVSFAFRKCNDIGHKR
jgi:hypothetical protein